MTHKNLLIMLIASLTVLFSGTDGQIRGKVTNTEGENLIGAQIYIDALGIGAVADINGNYIILNIPVGEYDVTATMISYRTQVFSDVGVIMDNTVWLNFVLDVEAIEGDVIYVSGEKALVEKGATSKKITISSEAIQALPIRDVSELYSLQSGVVKVEGGVRGGIPDHEEKGLEEVHVRGGRSGEIAYLIDGMYIRNPIYGGIGNGTRLNLFAVKEFDWQPGGFNAEYGDAMSAVSNMHTSIGDDEFTYKFKYETSLVGASIFDSHYDELRGYNDYNLGFGGALPFINDLKYWVSGQYTDKGNYEVYHFDSLVYVNGTDVEDYLAADWINSSYYDENKPEQLPPNTNEEGAFNQWNMVQPWDDEAGFRGFGMDRTWDVFGKLAYKLTSQIRFNFSYWVVAAHRKGFSPTFLYWDEGQNELFRDTERYYFELNHSLSSKTFYSIRYSKFEQKAFMGVRWKDSDSDGYPDWFEWSHGAGERTNFEGTQYISDANNPYVVPYQILGDSVFYTRRDGLGPGNGTSGWYFVDNNNDGVNDITPGNYNWDVYEPFNDINKNGVYDDGVDIFDREEDDFDGNGVWSGPDLVEPCEFRDGSYWLTPEMYVDHEDFYDIEYYANLVNQDPFTAYDQNLDDYFIWTYFNGDSLYFAPSGDIQWDESRAFGGHDRYYQKSNALTNEVRFDLTSQITDKWRARLGLDLKSHKLDYYQVKNPWDDAGALRQRFAEQWDDFGVDGVKWQDSEVGKPDYGEGNGQWDGPVHIGLNDETWQIGEPFIDCSVDNNLICETDDSWQDSLGNGTWDEGELFSDIGVDYTGESFDDFNHNDQWDSYVEPMEISGYFQNTFEVPWMVVNAGLRIDLVNYNSKIWADPSGNYSPYKPWFWEDCGLDGLCAAHQNPESYIVDEDGNYTHSKDPGEDDGEWTSWSDYSPYTGNDTTLYEKTTDNFGAIGRQIFFKDSEWQYKVSPRIGVSHVITDQSTFTFNYGIYHQTPVYENIYLNTSSQENPEELIEEGVGFIGNATMVASRTQSYEFAFNVQINRHWAYSVGAWVKDMDQLSSSKTHRSMIGEYSVASNADYGTAKGIDLSLENRGLLVNTVIQYTYSKAKANGEYDQSAFGNQFVDAPTQEFIMPFDRPHDLTVQLYTFLPFGINVSLVGFYQSGIPFTGTLFKGDGEPYDDVLNKYSKRTDPFKQIDISFSKFIELSNVKFSMGLNIFNAVDLDRIYSDPINSFKSGTNNVLDIYPETGSPTTRSEYYTREIGLPGNGGTISNSYYDTPWHFGAPREINFFIRIDYK